jgi:hypothetical protein
MGGSALEDFAIARAERDLKLLVDRATGLRIFARRPPEDLSLPRSWASCTRVEDVVIDLRPDAPCCGDCLSEVPLPFAANLTAFATRRV